MRKLPLLLLLVFSLACRTQKTTSTPQVQPVEITQDSRPSWVIKQPLDDSYYIGIAGVDKKEWGREYKAQARKEALHMLCSQIEVRMNSNSYLVTINRDYKFQQDYLTASKASVNTNIEGYNIKDEYESDKEYWVFLSLSKSEYRRRQQEKLNQASQTSLSFLEQADVFRTENKYSPAILFYGKALASMKNYLNEAVEAEYKGKNILLVNECFSRMQSLLNEIQLRFADNSDTLKFGIMINRKIPITAKRGNTPLSQLPLQFRFASGKGFINYIGTTDEKGQSMLQIQKIASNQAFQQVDATLDLEKICSSDTGWKDIRPFVDRLSRPTVSVFITVIAPRFYSSSVEKNLGRDLPESLLMRHIDKRLYDAGFQLTMNKSEADYVLHLEASTVKGSVAYDMVNTTLKFDLNMKLKGETIYTHSKNDVKGIRLDDESSGLNAYKNANDYIDLKVIPELFKLFFN